MGWKVPVLHGQGELLFNTPVMCLVKKQEFQRGCACGPRAQSTYHAHPAFFTPFIS